MHTPIITDHDHHSQTPPHDAQTLAALPATTYAQTFNYYLPEDLEHYLSTTYTTENYLAYLAAPRTAIWLAEDTDAPHWATSWQALLASPTLIAATRTVNSNASTS
ncbi:hypothetical protein [Rothia nasimurium]|uniref:hypothetical protein n=1 Tax=Rothia nasimurium TaxID=85336 RepID=UPI001ADD75F5|nr:hypothetical protein [Rothia nasimurium]